MWMTWSERIEAEGQRKGVQKLVLVQLEKKFGPLLEEVRQKVQEISSLKRLTRLAEKVLTARSLRELGFR